MLELTGESKYADIIEKEIYDDHFGANVIIAEGFKKINSGLYTKYDKNNFEKTRLKFIPYFGFANRGETDMQVFVKVK